MCFKMMSKQVNADTKTYFTMNNFKIREHEYKILKTKRASKQARIQSFSIRTVNDWNSLPPEVDQAKSRSLRIFWINTGKKGNSNLLSHRKYL